MLENYQRKMAQRSFSKNLKVRKTMFEKYQVLLGNGMSYQDITKRLLRRIGSDKITPQSAFLENVIEDMNEGKKFSDSLRGWASANEILIISSGEESGEDIKALEQCVRLMDKLIEMKKTIISASMFPSFLMTALFLVIFGFSKFMLPILLDFSDPETWSESSQNLTAFSTWVTDYIFLVLASFVAVFFGLKYSLVNFTGSIRDKYLDKIPPYSIYKEIQSGLFLVSLSTLLKSGVSFKKSLDFIRMESSDYLENKVEEILENVDAGLSEGPAMNTDFIGDVGDDIEDFAAGSTIEVTLSQIGDQVVNEKLDKIKSSANILKFIAMVAVFSYVLWAYSSFINITQSMDVS